MEAQEIPNLLAWVRFLQTVPLRVMTYIYAVIAYMVERVSEEYSEQVRALLVALWVRMFLGGESLLQGDCGEFDPHRIHFRVYRLLAKTAGFYPAEQGSKPCGPTQNKFQETYGAP